jgi:folylpolyglutamate synthase/dihydropteroate synthase
VQRAGREAHDPDRRLGRGGRGVQPEPLQEEQQPLLDLPRPKLFGRHQIVNAGTAIAALRAAGFGDIETAAYEAGMERAEWPGRLQRITRGRLPGIAPHGSELWLDGGHNPDGARALAASMADLEERNAAPLVLIVGMLGTKDTDAFLMHFLGLAREVIAVPIPTQVVSRTELRVTIPENLLGRAGNFPLVVKNPMPLATGVAEWGNTSNEAFILVPFEFTTKYSQNKY